MRIAALILTGAIALLHLYIAWFEIFAWETRGPAVFTAIDPALFGPTSDMAANQGLYNGFLAAGLIWSLTIKDQGWQARVATCFLMFIAVAGLFGAATISVNILIAQTGPAVAALALLWAGHARA